MKQFVKALDKQGLCFKYISENFPHLSAEKVKEGVFIGPQIRMLINDELFITQMNDTEKKRHGSRLKMSCLIFLVTKRVQITKRLWNKC